MTLATVNADDFEATIGDSFPFRFDADAEVTLEPLTLVSVKRIGAAVEGRRQAFSLLFEAAHGGALPQSIYPLIHEGLGDLDIFIVPLSQGEGRCTYEAVFT